MTLESVECGAVMHHYKGTKKPMRLGYKEL